MRAVLTLALGACNVFDPLVECASDRACPRGYACAPEGVCEVDEGEIVFGVSMPLSGALGTTGQQIATVFPLIEFQVTGAGGVDGRPVRFEVVDDETSPTRAVEVFDAFVDERVTGVVGPLTSPQAVEVLDATERAQLVAISSGAGANELSTGQPPIDRWFFRTMSSVERGSATALTRFARSNGCAVMLALHSDDAIGLTYRDALAVKFAEVDGQVLEPIAVPAGEQLDYTATIDVLVERAPECALLAVAPDVGAAILEAVQPRLAELPTGFFFIGSSSLGTADFIEESNRRGGIGEGLHGADVDTHPTTPEYGDFVRAYNGFYGLPETAPIPIYAANAYDAGMLLVLASAAGGTVDPVAYRDALWEITATGQDHVVHGPTDLGEALASLGRGDPIHFSGASSQLLFDGYGTVSLPSVVFQVQGDEVVIVERYSESGDRLD